MQQLLCLPRTAKKTQPALGFLCMKKIMDQLAVSLQFNYETAKTVTLKFQDNSDPSSGRHYKTE